MPLLGKRINGIIRMLFQMSSMVAVESWNTPERRSDGFESPEVKERSNLTSDHLFQNDIAKGNLIWHSTFVRGGSDIY
jgi:hypothetical protein